MAHRGRLNVLAHVLGRPYETILREFEGERTLEAVAADPEGGTGDVKYHLGAEGTRTTPSGEITRHARLEPEPPRGGRPGRRGPHARRADRPLDPRRATHDSVGRAADPDPRRRGVPGAGRRRRDAQPRRPRRLLDGRHAPPDREQPDRLHDRAGRRRARPATRATSRRASTSRSSTSTPTTPRRRSRRSGWRWRSAAASAPTS